MEPGLSPGIASISLVTLFVLTTSYPWCFAQISPCDRLSRRRSGSPERALYRLNPAVKFFSFVVPSIPCDKTSPKVRFDSLPDRTQRRWIGRPVHPLLTQIIPAPYLAVIPLIAPFHRSAHRHCTWNRARYPSSTSSRRFPAGGVEAMELINTFADRKVHESSRLRSLNSLYSYCRLQGRKQRQPPPVCRGFSQSLDGLTNRPEGQGFTVCVKRRSAESVRRIVFEPGSLRQALLTTTPHLAGSTLAGRVFPYFSARH